MQIESEIPRNAISLNSFTHVAMQFFAKLQSLQQKYKYTYFDVTFLCYAM